MSTDFAEEKKPARQRLLDTLGDLAWHPWKELKSVGGMRYSARLLELKREGYEIERRSLDEHQGFEYRLVSLDKGAPQEKKVRVYLPESAVATMLETNTLTTQDRQALMDALGSFRANKGKL